jgi:hypothetical protein
LLGLEEESFLFGKKEVENKKIIWESTWGLLYLPTYLRGVYISGGGSGAVRVS